MTSATSTSSSPATVAVPMLAAVTILLTAFMRRASRIVMALCLVAAIGVAFLPDGTKARQSAQTAAPTCNAMVTITVLWDTCAPFPHITLPLGMTPVVRAYNAASTNGLQTLPGCTPISPPTAPPPPPTAPPPDYPPNSCICPNHYCSASLCCLLQSQAVCSSGACTPQLCGLTGRPFIPSLEDGLAIFAPTIPLAPNEESDWIKPTVPYNASSVPSSKRWLEVCYKFLPPSSTI